MYRIAILRVFTEINSFQSYFRASTEHYDDIETSLKKITEATEPHFTRIRGLWRKLNVANPP